jgi:hypothetical protein
MEGYPAWQPTPTGYINNTTPFFYPRPEITGNILTLAQVYVSPQGSDDPNNNGVITSPFATISAALFYATNTLAQPLTTAVCIFVAPGTYEGGFSVPDNIYLIGPANTPQPVIIAGNIFASPTESSATIGLQNLTLQGVTVAGAFYDVNLEMINCKLQSDTIFSALTIAQESGAINGNVYATECMFVATDITNVSVISGNTSELTSLILDNCQLVTNGLEGSLIDMTGSLTVRNSSLLSTAAGDNLSPLIILQSGATLTPTVNLEGSVLKYDDLTADIGGNKLAIRFNAPTQPITARMTNCTVSIFLGAPNTDIVKNIGAQNVTMSQSANSCLKDGITIDTTNMVLTSAFFLQGSPLAPPPSAGVTFINSLDGAITLAGASGVSVGAVGNTITVSGSGVASLAGLTGTVTLSSPGGAIGITPNGQDIELTNTGIVSLAGLVGLVTLSSPDASINIGSVGSDITLEAVIPVAPVDSVGGKTGTILVAAGGGIDVSGGATNADPITISNTGVLSAAGLTGAVTLSGTNVSITPAGNNIDFAVSFPSPPVTSVGGKTGAPTFAAGTGIDVSGGATNADPITISNTGVLSVSAGTGMSASTTTGVATVTSISRQYTLGGATVGGVITYTQASGSLNQWTSSTWTLMNTIQINVPAGWVAGQSVGFDGYEYINWDSNTTSYYTIYYVTPSQATEQSLIGDRTAGFTDAIYGNNSGQAYLPLNLSIPPTYLASGQTITLRVYGYVTAALHYMVSNPLIDARVNIVYP